MNAPLRLNPAVRDALAAIVHTHDGVRAVVPEVEVESARCALAQRLRLRLAPDTPLPSSARLVRREGCGSVVLETDGDPLHLVRELPNGTVLAAEAGVLRLEDLYERLFLDVAETRP